MNLKKPRHIMKKFLIILISSTSIFWYLFFNIYKNSIFYNEISYVIFSLIGIFVCWLQLFIINANYETNDLDFNYQIRHIYCTIILISNTLFLLSINRWEIVILVWLFLYLLAKALRPYKKDIFLFKLEKWSLIFVEIYGITTLIILLLYIF